ncbi:hypothetical protein M2475_001943 [Breznakia sp. PF5-3]|uniref:relaxase/mobilization nuclease domain-containing protein n=1 Tax=unclassified Breznakia TaxID=2623764 RepID=UPI0024056079|nr:MULTISPECIES: relaxase/mobilization nuclease domain-containing protein [unclassified Breznakia]MDF9825478.1 hypothetical protein [Breznakia sp. PM6-1]MDF9836363.1 hypothetical protein [Breznakia sp. PF5-3]MDF9838931.1 hypothetical protein [Breznakia sp. PFB2-8]MDF9860961.1 hypothetical protein [Breznakia sp. PH5-24]
MATTKLWKVKGRLDAPINYVINDDKTAFTDVIEYATHESKTVNVELISTINCLQDNPIQAMMNTKKLFKDNKEIICFHGYQSFHGYEIEPEVAHQIGVELANRLWGEKYEVVITTHIDTNNIHNHFVLNSTSMVDGKRFTNSKKDYHDMRTVSDELCNQHGLSIIEEKSYQSKSRNSYRNDISIRSKIKKDISEVIKKVFTTRQLFRELEGIGYEIKETNKNISLKHPEHKKFIRLSSLGDKYQIDEIQDYLSSRAPIRDDNTIYDRKQFDIDPYIHKYRNGNLTGLQKVYIRYQYMLGIVPKSTNRNIKYSKELRKAIRYMDTISDQTILLCRNNLNTFTDLKNHEELLNNELNLLLQNRQQYYNKIRRCNDNNLKDEMKSEAKKITPKIKSVRKQIKLCTGIEDRSIRMKEFELEIKSAQKSKGVKEYERN